MSQKLIVKPIGKIEIDDEGMFVALDSEYAPALNGLDEYSHLTVLWWFGGNDNAEARETLEVRRPYKHSTGTAGVFATRSPRRPNPIALTTAEIIHLDHQTGRVQISFTDADDQSPVLDLKPYCPSLDRVEQCSVPDWCAHWPKSLEESATFDWESEFVD